MGIFFGVELAVDGGEGAEELIGDVGEDSGFARRDTILREKKEEAYEKIVDGDGGAEFLEVGGEGGGGVGRSPLVLNRRSVIGAVRGVRVWGEKAAAHAIGKAVRAARRAVDEAEFSRLMGRIVAAHFPVATPRAKPDRTRPLCPYPQVAKYKGSGSTDDGSNFACTKE